MSKTFKFDVFFKASAGAKETKQSSEAPFTDFTAAQEDAKRRMSENALITRIEIYTLSAVVRTQVQQAVEMVA
jgi:hypothetical protein